MELKRFLDCMNQIAPERLAEEWDNVGLVIGTNREINKIGVALDLSAEVAAEAVARGADLLLTHHPIWLKGIKRMMPEDGETGAAYTLIRNGIGLYCTHTNLDFAAGGVNDILAKALGLSNLQWIRPAKASIKKLCVYVPEDYIEQVKNAIMNAGAGQMGEYSDCSWQVMGRGEFKPLCGANPYIGKIEQTESVKEVKIETIVPAAKIIDVISALRRAHPYEEPAFDVYSLESEEHKHGLGRVGELQKPAELSMFVKAVENLLETKVKYIGMPNQIIKKVAICGGSGMELVKEAIKQGADVFLTADIKYHDAKNAAALGLPLIDGGHYETEQLVLIPLIDYLQAVANSLKCKLDIYRSDAERPIFRRL